MTELEQSLLTFVLTITGGVTLLVVGQLLTRFYVDALIQQRREIAKVHNVLRYYANIITSPAVVQPEQRADLARLLRQASVDLHVATFAIPTYGLFQALGWAPSLAQVTDAYTRLLALSNSLVQGEELANFDRIQAVLAALRLPSI